MENTQLKSFKDLIVWQKSSDLAVLVYLITEKFPRSELYGLTNQMRRSVVSTSSNIAEGFKRSHHKEKIQFYNIAYGSVAELESQIEIALKLNFLNKEEYQKLNTLTVEVGKMLDGLIKSVNKSSKSYFLNSIFFFAFLYSIFYILNPVPVHAASLYFSPATGSYATGKTFSVGVYVANQNQTMNAASGIISFPKDKLEIISLSKSGSIFSLWVQEPSFSNSAGVINFEGIVLNPGFIGSGGKIMTANFKVKSEGQAVINFSSGSVLANDGAGTNILGGMGSGNYKLLAATVSPEPLAEQKSEKKQETALGAPAAPLVISSTHSDSIKWYNNKNPQFSWTLPSGVNGVSFYFSQSSASNPGPASDGIFANKSYKNIEDGVWYFHIKFRNSYGWGPITHFKIQIDTTSPSPFEIKFIDGKETENPRPTVVFETTDSLSGIDYYKIKIGEEDYFDLAFEKLKSNPYILPPQLPGKRNILVKAFDKAGNYTIATDEFIIKPLQKPIFTEYPKELESGDILIVKGESQYPNSQIVIWLQKEKDEPKSQVVISDKDGKFVFISDDRLKDGVYKIWAEVIDEREAKSEPSVKLPILVSPTKFQKFGSWTISFFAIVIPLVALIVLLMSILWYGWHKFSLLRKRLRKEVREVESALHKAFNLLKEDIQKQIKMLEKTRVKRQLTKEEEKIFKQLKQNLDDTEKFARKEIEDIKNIEKEVK